MQGSTKNNKISQLLKVIVYRIKYSNPLLFVIFLYALFFCKSSMCYKEEWYWYFLPVIIIISLITHLSKRKIINLNYTDLILLTVLIIISINNAIKGKAFIANSEFVIIVTSYLLYFLIRLKYADWDIYGYIYLLLFVGGIEIISSICQLFHNNKIGIVGTFKNSAYDAQLIALSLPAYFYITKLIGSQLYRSTLRIILFIITFLLIVKSESRTALISVAMLLILNINFKKKYSKLIGILCILGCIVGCAVAIKTVSTKGRILILKVLASKTSIYFLSGIGTSGYFHYYPLWQALFFKNHPQSNLMIYADDVLFPFNSLILLIIENGIFCLILFGFALTSLLVLNKYHNKSKIKIIKQLLIILLIQSMTSNILQINFCLLSFFVFMAYISSFSGIKKISLGNMKFSKLGQILIGLLIFTGVLSSMYLLFYSKSLFEWNSKRKNNNYTEYSCEKTAIFKNPYFLYAYSKWCFDKNDNRKSISLLLELQKNYNFYDSHILLGLNYMAQLDYNNAKKEFEFTSDFIPHRLYPKYLLMMNSKNSGDTLAEREYARTILKMEPKIKSSFSDEIKNQARKILEISQ